jgi:hypothetical protein
MRRTGNTSLVPATGMVTPATVNGVGADGLAVTLAQPAAMAPPKAAVLVAMRSLRFMLVSCLGVLILNLTHAFGDQHKY